MAATDQANDSTLPITKGPSSTGYTPADWFWESRKKDYSSSGTALFTVLRALDLPVQWLLLKSGPMLLQRIGLSAARQTYAGQGFFGLSPYHTLLLGLATGSTLKQVYWKAFIGDTKIATPFIFAIAVYNTLVNGINTSMALWEFTSQQPTDQSSLTAMVSSAPLPLQIGLGLYLIGLFTEWWCEIQRKAFKQDPRNKGKPYAGGLFALARNINYGGYTLWRTGYAFVAGGWAWAVPSCAWFAGDFISRAIPSMDAYCEKRYGQQWQQVKRRVPYKLLPFVY